jgi:periplasmic divalent cation tolerance protein
MPETEYVVVLTTWPATDSEVDAVARRLVSEQLAACVNVLPEMRSIYRWQGSVEEAAERQLLIKTTRSCLGALRARIHELHPYDVPEFLVLAVADGGDTYLNWIRESVHS